MAIEISLELITLILGLVGSATGVASLIVHALKFRKERPNIVAELVDAKHFYRRRDEGEEIYQLGFLLDTQVINKGDRGTTIGKAILHFTIGEKRHHITAIDFEERLEPNDMTTVRPHFVFDSSYDEAPEQEEIPFKLILGHTDKKIVLHGKSKLLP